MPNKDGTANVWDQLKAISVAAVFALLIVWAGSSVKHSWLVILVTPACTIVGAFLVAKAASAKVKLETQVWWGAIGLTVGIIWYLAS